MSVTYDEDKYDGRIVYNKANYFSNLFASQCTRLVKYCKLPYKITYNSAARLTSIRLTIMAFLKLSGL